MKIYFFIFFWNQYQYSWNLSNLANKSNIPQKKAIFLKFSFFLVKNDKIDVKYLFSWIFIYITFAKIMENSKTKKYFGRDIAKKTIFVVRKNRTIFSFFLDAVQLTLNFKSRYELNLMNLLNLLWIKYPKKGHPISLCAATHLLYSTHNR